MITLISIVLVTLPFSPAPAWGHPVSGAIALPRDTIGVERAVMDSLTDLWSDDAFGSTIDGQPRSPSGAEVTFDIWWESHRRGSRPVWVEIVPSYSPPWPGFRTHSPVATPFTVRWTGGGQ